MTAAATDRDALRARLRAQSRPAQIASPHALTCRVWPEHSLENWAMHDREYARGSRDTDTAAAALWRYLSGENPATPNTLRRLNDVAAIVKGTPNGTLWAVLPAVVHSWSAFKDYSDSVYPPLASSPELASVARGYPFGWWLTLDGLGRYRPALQAGIMPGGPATGIHSEGGIGGAGEVYNLDLAIDRYTRCTPDKRQFIRFVEYHDWNWDTAASEWQRAGNTIPVGLDAEAVHEVRQNMTATNAPIGATSL